jgi:magnesium transporter
MLTLYQYSAGKIIRMENPAPAAIKRLIKQKIWLDFCNPSRKENEILSSVFNFHPLAVEDCLAPIDSPKIDIFEDYIFIILKAVKVIDVKKRFKAMEIDFFMGKNYLVTYHKEKIPSVTKIEQKLLASPKTMNQGSDFLLHQIVDTLVDNYFLVLNSLDEKIERVETALFRNPGQVTLNTLANLKKELLYFKRLINPEREIFNRLSRKEFKLITPKNAIYFRDVFDHLYRLSELTDLFRDTVTSGLETYLSVVSYRMNEVMKVLTVIATIFMPLTLITGIYGMNFDFMPELHWRYGYFIVWGLMAVMIGGMVIYFKRRKIM